MKQLVISEPNEKQKKFFESKNRFIGYGGDSGEFTHDGSFCGNGLVFADRKLTPKSKK